jgi:hypothetical protein
LYSKVIDLIIITAPEAGKRKFGHMRSPELKVRGQAVLLYKKIYYTRKRNAPPLEAIKNRAEKHRVDLDKETTKTKRELRQEITLRQKKFWDCEKVVETKRVD